MEESPWYRRFFDEAYLRLYPPFFTPERTAAEVEGIVKLLALPTGGRVLDLACGTAATPSRWPSAAIRSPGWTSARSRWSGPAPRRRAAVWMSAG